MKKIIVSACLFLLSFPLFAEEGMWIPSLLKKLNESDMQTMGMKLCAEDIYSINHSSIKDAIVSMNGGGCTAEVISEKGLMLTNHHCGYSDIQSLSSIEHDYLKNGFWAMSAAEELPTTSRATFIVRMEDVTSEVLKDVVGPLTEEAKDKMKKNALEIIAAATKDNHYEAIIKPFNYGNSFFLIVQETFTDLRLVFAPPSSIGKFGGDTDNWMWPRHTGDFSIYRIYAGKDNKPAAYSKDNVPYKPAHSLPVSISGVKDNDFTMVFGFPGATKEYLPSYAVENIINVTNPAKIKMRESSLEIIDAAMRSSDTIRIQYAAKQARISNAYKKWIGESKGLIRLNAVEKKKAGESEFTKRVYQNPEYINKYGKTLENLKNLNEKYKNLSLAGDYFTELTFYGPEFIRFARNYEKLVDEFKEISKDKEKLSDETDKLMKGARRFFKNYNAKTDRKIFEALFKLYREGVPAEFLPDYMQTLDKKYKGKYDLLAKDIYEKSFFTDSTRLIKMLKNFSSSSVSKIKSDPAYLLMKGLYEGYNYKVFPDLQFLSFEIDKEMQTYVAGLMEVIPEKKYWFDANSTLRVAYGKIEGSAPRDGMLYTSYTTLDGLIDKYVPGDVEFDVPEKLLQLYASKDYGIYAEDGKVHVAFTASNQTTGGNSGSPVLNAYGELIGVNFDRTWESTMSDVMYDPEFCRNIALDIRYVLFIIDKFAGAGYLLEEMNLMDDEKREEIEKEKHRKELNALTDSLKADANNTGLLLRHAEKLNELKLFNDALTDYKKADQLKMNDEKIMLLLAGSFVQNKMYNDASKVVDKLMKMKNIPTETYLISAGIKYSSASYSQAVNDLNKYLGAGGKDIEAYRLRALSLDILGKQEEACRDIKYYTNNGGTLNSLWGSEICR